MVTNVTPDEDPMGVWPTVQRVMREANAVNVNPETGIRYGIISANSLDPEVVTDLQFGRSSKDLHWEEALSDLRKEIEREVESGELALEDSDDEYTLREERLGDAYYDDEPVHSFDVDGVKGQTTWLGGALLVWVFHSTWLTKANLCSPCVPNCGNLDSLNPDGYECYCVPPLWRYTP